MLKMFPRNLNLEPEIRSSVEGIPYTYEVKREDSSEDRPANFSALMLIGTLLFITGMAALSVNFAVAGAVAGLGFLMMIGGAFAVKMNSLADLRTDLDEEYKVGYGESDTVRDSWAKAEARKKEVDEIVKTVKSMIRVRCRYCGTLNDETANKCEKCGGTL